MRINEASIKLAQNTLARLPESKRRRVCVPAPIGCDKPITGFNDALSQREYQISGLCQDCQDKFFGK